jgi:tetratricopeptide (TPR) repeat protein
MRAVLCLLLLCLGPGWANANTGDFNAAVDRANKAILEGKFAEAEKQINAAAKAQPNAAEVPNLRGVLRTRERRYAEAAEQYNRALAVSPKFYPAKFNLAELALLRGDVQEALQRYQDLRAVDPASEVLQFKIATCYVLSGEDAKAKAVTDVIHFPGNTPAYYYARAAAWAKKGNWSQVDYYLASAHKYYEDNQCAYFETSLQAVGFDLAKRTLTVPSRTPGPAS